LIGGLSLLFTVAVWLILPKPETVSDRGKTSPFAFAQIAILLACVLVISVGSVIEGTEFKIIGLGGGLAMLGMLAFVEKRSSHRLLPAGSFSLRQGHFSLYMLMLALACAVNGAEIFIPLFLQILHHVSPLEAGYIAAILSMGWTCGALYSAPATKSRQPNLVILAPYFGLAGAGLLFFILPAPELMSNRVTTLLLIGLGLFLIGLSPGLAWPHLLTRVMSWASAGDADRASTSITLIQIFSSALGSALAGSLTNLAGIAPLGSALVNRMPAQFLFITVIFLLLMALFFAYGVGQKIGQESKG